MRALYVVLNLCCLATSGCDPATGAALAAAPPPAVASDSAGSMAFALARRVAQRHGLKPVHRGELGGQGWQECFARSAFVFCGKLHDKEVQFLFFQSFRIHFGPLADSVRRELRDSLRAEFGPSRVHDCDWRVASDPRGSGCRPLRPQGNTSSLGVPSAATPAETIVSNWHVRAV